MERSCNCCNYHSHRHRVYDEGTGEARQPSPAWPLVLLCLVFTLLMGPFVLEPPEEVFSISQIGAFFMLLPFLLLLAFYFFNTNTPSSTSAINDHYTHNYPSSHSYNGYSQHSPPPSEEPLHGWGLFLMFILAIILLPLTRS